MSGLDDLAAFLRAEGGLIGGAVDGPRAGADASLGDLVAGRGEDYPLVLEAVREGHLLHHGEPRVVGGEDPDLALLAGDRLYALGLEKLAALGDVASVAILSGVISDCARAHAEGRDADADGIFRRGAEAIARGA